MSFFFFFLSVWWYEETSACCHNALLVFCGQEEPGSAPVTQLLMALVLSFGLTSSTCLLILRPHCSLSAQWNVFRRFSYQKHRQTPNLHNLARQFFYLSIYLIYPNHLSVYCKRAGQENIYIISIFLTCFFCVWTHSQRVLGEMHSFASLATDVGESIFFLLLLWAEHLECLKTVRCGP